MNTENEALIGLLRRKSHSIPLGVRYWTFYKKSLLENDAVREKFTNKDLTFDEFKTRAKRLLRNSPARRNRHTKNWRNTLDRDLLKVLYVYHKSLLAANVPWTVQRAANQGLGIFAKRAFRWTTGDSKALFGIVCGISEDDFTELRERKYPSLFSSRNTGSGILFGPASLVNHSCSAQASWSAPCKRGVPELFEGFNALRLKMPPNTPFKMGEEIHVKYGMRKKDFDCNCEKCAAK